jgi:hypothetical protein
MKNRQGGNKRNLRRRREREQRRMDKAAEQLLLELAHRALAVLRMALV